ncbi:hypothetical protein QJS66_05545 [Kocuria rhizophila]|nr:hypothetical protein QJS66_05545 [Kocuria rhizophila]
MMRASNDETRSWRTPGSPGWPGWDAPWRAARGGRRDRRLRASPPRHPDQAGGALVTVRWTRGTPNATGKRRSTPEDRGGERRSCWDRTP